MSLNLKTLLMVSADQLVRFWRDFSRKAYLEPIIVRDGYHDYVLIGLGEFDNMTTELEAAREQLKIVRWEDGDHGSCFLTQAEFDRRKREGHREPRA